jgi:hypothetical protein
MDEAIMPLPRKKSVTFFTLIITSGIIAACGTGASWVDGVPTPSSGIDQSTKTSSVFSFPRLGIPGFGNRQDAGLPAEERQCRATLKRMGVTFIDIPEIYDSPSCGIKYPVEVSGLARGVALKPAAKLNCQAALSMAQWLQRDAGPAARARYLSGIAEIRQMSSYSCRQIARTDKWSEHSKGNAVDIGAFKLKNGRVIKVAKPAFFAWREKSFLKSVRGQACHRFGTVLGPGDRDHHDHFHFDIRQRKKAYCSM